MKLKNIVLTALITAICVIGSFIKIPGFIQTAALDSAPAFISAIILPPVFAGLAGALGHMATAVTSGMPLGPFHLIIGFEMFVIVWFFAILHRKGFRFLQWIFLLVANGVLAALPFYFIISPAFYIGSLPSMISATAINMIVTIIVLPFLAPVISRVRQR